MPKKELDLYINNMKMIYKILRNKKINVDLVSKYSDLGKYKLVVASLLSIVDDETADNLTNYVSNGGKLVCTPFSGLVNKECSIYNDRIHPKLKELFSLDLLNFNALKVDRNLKFKYNSKSYYTNLFIDLPYKINSREIGKFCEDKYQNYSPLYINQYNKGYAYYISTFADREFYTDFFDTLELDENNYLFRVDDDKVEISKRENNDFIYYFIINGNKGKTNITFMRDVMDIWNKKEIKKGSYDLNYNDILILKVDKQ